MSDNFENIAGNNLWLPSDMPEPAPQVAPEVTMPPEAFNITYTEAELEARRRALEPDPRAFQVLERSSLTPRQRYQINMVAAFILDKGLVTDATMATAFTGKLLLVENAPLEHVLDRWIRALNQGTSSRYPAKLAENESRPRLIEVKIALQSKAKLVQAMGPPDRILTPTPILRWAGCRPEVFPSLASATQKLKEVGLIDIGGASEQASDSS